MPEDSAPLNTFSPDLFRGSTALVTGGGRGIGKRIALAFARFGANVVIAGRHAETLDPTAAEIEIRGSSCLAIPTNIREIAEVDALVERSVDRFGTIDILVNNAGGQFPARPSAISDRGWRSVIDLNLNGTWEELTHANVEIDDAETLALDDIPAHRFGTADEIAAVVLFLASPGGRYINGTTVVADGAYALSNWTSPWDPEVS